MSSDDLWDMWLAHNNRYDSKTPPPSGYCVNISPEAMGAIGQVVVMWGVLDFQTRWVIKMLPLHHNLTQVEIGRPPRNEYKYLIAFLAAKISERYATNKNIIKQFAKLQNAIIKAKAVRDQLAHGAFESAHNEDPNVVTVQYKSIRHTYPVARLSELAIHIGQLAGQLSEFHAWANYPEQRALIETRRLQACP